MGVRIRSVRQILLVVVPACCAMALAIVWLNGRPQASTENAYVKADIVQISAETAGRVIEVAVRDHAVVAKGAVLVRLDPEPFRLALAKADAELAQARIQVETVRATVLEAQMELKEAESRVGFTEQQFARQKQLASRGIASTAKLEEFDSNAITARDHAQLLRLKVARSLAALGGDIKLPADSHGLVMEKQAARDRAALDLEQATVRAPVDGIAVNVKVQPGEQLRPAIPIFAIVSSARPWIEANFKETDLTTVRPGHRAEVTFDLYPDQRWQAEVETISPATGAEFAILPPQNASGNWVKIVQRLPVRLRLLPQPGEPILRAGMTAQVTIDTGADKRITTLTRRWSTNALASPLPR